jgi:hypothetical protein
MKLDLAIDADEKVKSNFREIENRWNGSPLSNGEWQFFTKNLAVGNHFVYHKLGFKPLDVIQTSLTSTGAGSVTYNYSQFTSEYIYLTVSTASVSVRFVAGRFG